MRQDYIRLNEEEGELQDEISRLRKDMGNQVSKNKELDQALK